MTDALAGMPLGNEVLRFVLVLLRVSGIVAFCPIFSSSVLPRRFRVSLALALAVVLLPLVPATQAIVPLGLDTLALVLRELVVGIALGIAARVVIDGIQGAAHVVSGQAGFSLISMVDPLTGSQSITPALFQTLLATTLILAANLHHLFIKALVSSYALLPPKAALPSFAGFEDQVITLGGRMFGVAVELAAPGLLATFAVDVVLILVGRAMPQVPILLVGYPLKVTAGLVAMVLMTFAMGSMIRWIGSSFASDGAALLSALGAR